MNTRAFTVIMAMVTLSLLVGLALSTGQVTASSNGENGDATDSGKYHF